MHPLNTSRWNAKSWRDTLVAFADTNNLLLVCPDGGFNGNILDQIDTAFTTALVDSMFHWYNIDSSQVYMMGFSWGGKATYVYGIEHSDFYAGYLIIGAATSIADLPTARLNKANCKPFSIIHGAFDAVSTRFTPMVNAIKTRTSFVWDTLMPSVGHTIDFPSRNSILTKGFKYIYNVNKMSLSINLGPDKSQCGASSVQLGDSIDIKSGACNFTYHWSPGTGLSDSTIANPSVSVASNSSFILKVMDDQGNAAFDTISVILRNPPTVSVGADDTICPSNRKFFTATGASNYTWSPSAGLTCSNCSQPGITINAKKTYYILGTDSFGCSNRDTLNLDVFAAPRISTSADTSICLGDSGRFNTTGGVSYRWTSSNHLSDSSVGNPFFFPKTNGFFVVYGTDSNGCVGNDFTQVVVRKLPQIQTSADTTICFGAELELRATGTNSYYWSGHPSLSCSACQTTTFKGDTFSFQPYDIVVEGKDNYGCRAYDTVAVNVLRPVSISFSQPDTICAEDYAYLVVRAGGHFRWLNASTLDCDTCVTVKASPLQSTTYLVEVTDIYNCTDTGNLTLTVNPLPTTQFFGDSLICKGDTGTILLSSTGTINWLTTTNINDPSSLAPKVWPSNSAYYHLTSTSKEQCTSWDSVFIQVQNPNADFKIITPTGTNFGHFDFDETPSKNYDNYVFDYNGAPGIAGINSFSYSQNGSYNVCLTVSTNEGCSNKTCKEVKVVSVGYESKGFIKRFTVFPNPTNGLFQLVSKSNEKINTVNVFDQQGRKIRLDTQQSDYDISSLPKGHYILEISTEKEIIRTPLIKH